MNEYLLIIHRVVSKEGSPSPQQLQDAIKPFQDWIGGIAEIKEAVSGTILIRAKDYDEAAEIAKGCPALKWGSVVEIRMALPTA